MTKQTEKKDQRMIYCDGEQVGTKSAQNHHHKGLHYMIIDEDAKLPAGFRETPDKPKAKKPTKAELAAIKEAEEEAELAAMEAEEAADKAKEA